mmetsp:Transcript_48896/g.121321  ORF Transcript_48896/g.121321 Transcript_48896/m.121321 type:complete len:231 (-) Transcript_48896:625-1317(-)
MLPRRPSPLQSRCRLLEHVGNGLSLERSRRNGSPVLTPSRTCSDLGMECKLCTRPPSWWDKMPALLSCRSRPTRKSNRIRTGAEVSARIIVHLHQMKRIPSQRLTSNWRRVLHNKCTLRFAPLIEAIQVTTIALDPAQETSAKQLARGPDQKTKNSQKGGTISFALLGSALALTSARALQTLIGARALRSNWTSILTSLSLQSHGRSLRCSNKSVSWHRQCISPHRRTLH